MSRREREQERATDGGAHCYVHARYVLQGPGAQTQLQQQTYYLNRRKTGQTQDAPLFSGARLGMAAADDLTRKEARALLTQHPDETYAFHRYILSPSRGLGLLSPAEMRVWTRDVMAAWSAHLGRELTWVGAIHTDKTHLHAHLVIAGSARVHHSAAYTALKIKPPHIDALRRICVEAGARVVGQRAAIARTLLEQEGAAIQARARQLAAVQAARDAHTVQAPRRRFGWLKGAR